MSCGNPHDTPCSEVLDRVYEYLDGELDRERVHVIKEHLEECSPCLAEFGLEDAVKSIVKRSCSDPAPADLRSKVLRRIEAVGDRERKFLRERRASRRTRTERRHDLDAVLQVDQAFGMRRHRHAETDDRDAMLAHMAHCSARIAPRSSARPLSRPMPV